MNNSQHQVLLELMQAVGTFLPNRKKVQEEFPNWRVVQKDAVVYAFKEVECVEGFSVAVRVGYDGIHLFAKAEKPDPYWLTEGHFATLQDFCGSKGEGFQLIQVGEMSANGDLSFSDCLFEPGLKEDDFLELKKVLQYFGEQFLRLNQLRRIGIL